MYTGIIQTLATVKTIEEKPGLKSFVLEVEKKFLDGIFVGASCSVDGACFTVVAIKGTNLWFDAIQETLDKTTLSQLQVGSKVHFERSLKYGDENGGHSISGHVHGTCEIKAIKTTENNWVLRLAVEKNWIKYFFEKGFISLHGASLTLSLVDEHESCFEVSLIPETLRQTNFGGFKVGDRLNFEVEQQTRTIVDVIERTLTRKS